MNRFDRRTLLRNSGLAAAALTLRTKAWAWADGAPLATTTAGKISGVMEDGINVFKGVPYGGDTAKTRFQAPVAPEKWTGVRECVAFTTMAPQLVAARAGGAGAARPGGAGPGAGAAAGMAAATSSSGVPGAPRDQGVQSEDCLHLNVFTPGLRDKKKRPVLLYIHGGAYNNGTVNSDLYDGKRLCQRGDVVVVTVNHRLNAFGYLYLGDLAPAYKDSGNAGQLDLVLALKWVKENAAEFGGDPTRVLIFGQSGGGAKCAALMATPVAHGLFHRVMTMSGQQIKGASIEIASGRTKTVLEKMGASGLTGKDLEAKLNSLTMEQIQEGARAVSSDWLPVVDNVILFRNPFDPDAPALSEDVPMMLGNTHDETGAVNGPANMTWEQAVEAVNRGIPDYLGPVTAQEAVDAFRKADPTYTPQQVARAVGTAFRAWAGQRMEAERRAANPVSQPHTWVYQMNFKGADGWATHTIDIPFMFDNIAIAQRQVGSEPEHLAEANALAAIMSQMLITYGRTGNPNGDDKAKAATQDGKLPYWPAYDLKNMSTMMWEAKPRVENDPRGAERVEAEKAHYHQAGTPLP
ncbi:MAG: carboxylesterase family protein [Acidobacteriaceae bacterium]|jgi:para-nitrobenzyl esterase